MAWPLPRKSGNRRPRGRAISAVSGARHGLFAQARIAAFPAVGAAQSRHDAIPVSLARRGGRGEFSRSARPPAGFLVPISIGPRAGNRPQRADARFLGGSSGQAVFEFDLQVTLTAGQQGSSWTERTRSSSVGCV